MDAVREQALISVRNRATLESSLIAPLRNRRPMDGHPGGAELDAAIAATVGDPFCHPLSGTPANTFGRIAGRHMVTGANAAIADAHHAVLVFDRHDPLDFDHDLVADLLETGRSWAERARGTDSAAVHYTLLWNCLWRAGGSIIHGHGQALLGHACTARLERFRADAQRFRHEHGVSFAEDLAVLHDDLGLAIHRDDAVTTIASVTPIKEREIWVIGREGMDERDPRFATAVGDAAVGFRDRLGVTSFNLLLWRPPLDGADAWKDVPPIARLVDRGDPFARPSDIGAMELYGTPIVGADPYDVVAAFAG